MDDQNIESVTGPVSSRPQGEAKSDVQRGTPEVEAARKALVARWQKEILADKTYFKNEYKRMRSDMEYARLGADKAWVDGDNYTVPIINRHINQAVASLYAKSPKAVCKRRPRIYNRVWDGTQESAQAAYATYQATKGTEPQSAAIVSEIAEAKQKTQMYDKLCRTLEILFGYYTGESTPNFKKQMKQMIRRAKTTSVGYVELDFQRILEPNPEVYAQIDDMTALLANIESQLADMQDGELEEGAPDVEQLRLNLETLQGQKDILIREGLVFDFPKSTDIIPHREVKQLEGFVGADYVTKEFELPVQTIQEIYKVDVKSSYRAYSRNADTTGVDEDYLDRKDDNMETTGNGKKSSMATARLWRVQDKKNRQVFTLVEGYPDFVEAPRSHPLKVDGFFTIVAFPLNPVESETDVFPLSDVHYLKHPQREYNNARQGVREHRQANRPKYFMRRGAMEEKEKEMLQSAVAHSIIELKGMDEKTPIDSIIQGFRGLPIDPNLYETSSIIQDVMFGVGSQNANLGPTGGATATEVSTAEQSRMSSLASNVDDLDEFLSEIAKMGGQIMMAELSAETVREIVGPGAVWPQLSREEIAKDVFLEIKAGSSGRPNRAAELANMERGMPFLLQMQGVSGPTLAKRYADLLDLEVEELIIDGIPSVVALNSMAAKSVQQGGAASDPNQNPKGGAQNAANVGVNGRQQGPQPAFPAG